MYITRKPATAGVLGGILFALCAAPPASAQQIVNVSATQSGVTAFDFKSGILLSPVQVSLGAGTYTLTAVTPSTDSQALFTSWSYNSPWVWQVFGFDDAQPVFKGSR